MDNVKWLIDPPPEVNVKSLTREELARLMTLRVLKPGSRKRYILCLGNQLKC
jgi:hypothetical protein